MPLGKSPALTPGRLAAEGRDSRLCGNGVYGGREPIRATGRMPFGPRVREKNSFFVTFKAGMLLKTRQSRTKYTKGQVSGARCQVSGVGSGCWGAEQAAEKLSSADNHPSAKRATPPESAPLERRDGRLRPRKIAVLAIMCMKKQGLIGNSREMP